MIIQRIGPKVFNIFKNSTVGEGTSTKRDHTTLECGEMTDGCW
jgi:hypothetical protein